MAAWHWQGNHQKIREALGVSRNGSAMDEESRGDGEGDGEERYHGLG